MKIPAWSQPSDDIRFFNIALRPNPVIAVTALLNDVLGGLNGY
jgi:hypothetical protein